MIALLPGLDSTDERYLSVERENERTQEWWDNRLSARSPWPIIVNGDFGELGTSNLPSGWTLVNTPTIASATSAGLGNGISMTGAVGAGIQYAFNVKPCTDYTVVYDYSAAGKVDVVRVGQTNTSLNSQTFDVGTTTWYHSPSITVGILTARTNSTDTTLTIQLLINKASTEANFAQVQIWEGSWPRPFQDFRQGLEGWFKKFTANSFVYAGASGILASTAAATNGQLLIGSTGAVPVRAALTGTTNQLNVTNGAGTITLSTPQDTHTAATPQFARLGLGTAASASVPLYVLQAGSSQALLEASSGVGVGMTFRVGANDLTFLYRDSTGTFVPDLMLRGPDTFGKFVFDLSTTNGFFCAFSRTALTANRTYTYPNATGTLTLLELAQTFTANQTFNSAITTLGAASATTGQLRLYNSASANATIIQAGNATAAVTYTLPTADGTNGQKLTTNGAGVLSWTT